MFDDFEEPLVVFPRLSWRSRVVSTRRCADAHVLNGRYSSLDGARRNVDAAGHRISCPFAFSISRFLRRFLLGFVIECGTLFAPDK